MSCANNVKRGNQVCMNLAVLKEDTGSTQTWAGAHNGRLVILYVQLMLQSE